MSQHHASATSDRFEVVLWCVIVILRCILFWRCNPATANCNLSDLCERRLVAETAPCRIVTFSRSRCRIDSLSQIKKQVARSSREFDLKCCEHKTLVESGNEQNARGLRSVARAASGCTHWNHLCAYSFSLGSLQNIGLVMPKTRMCERIFVRKEDTTVYKPRCMLERNETSERIGDDFL